MKITVTRCDGFSFDMRAEPDDLVVDVKGNIEKICGRTRYRFENQLLRYEGKDLKDDTTLKDNHVHDKCSVVLIRQVLDEPSRDLSTTTFATTMGIPAHAEVLPAGRPLTSSSAASASVQASRLTLPPAQASQPVPPAPSASPVPKAISHKGLDHLGFNPQFRALRALVQANPQILEPMLEELGRQNPDIGHSIQDHQAEFMQDMLQPLQSPVDNSSNQSADAVPQEMKFTPADREAIDRLEAMGFDIKKVVEVFLACNKDEALAADRLLGQILTEPEPEHA